MNITQYKGLPHDDTAALMRFMNQFSLDIDETEYDLGYLNAEWWGYAAPSDRYHRKHDVKMGLQLFNAEYYALRSAYYDWLNKYRNLFYNWCEINQYEAELAELLPKLTKPLHKYARNKQGIRSNKSAARVEWLQNRLNKLKESQLKLWQISDSPPQDYADVVVNWQYYQSILANTTLPPLRDPAPTYTVTANLTCYNDKYIFVDDLLEVLTKFSKTSTAAERGNDTYFVAFRGVVIFVQDLWDWIKLVSRTDDVIEFYFDVPNNSLQLTALNVKAKANFKGNGDRQPNNKITLVDSVTGKEYMPSIDF